MGKESCCCFVVVEECQKGVVKSGLEKKKSDACYSSGHLDNCCPEMWSCRLGWIDSRGLDFWVKFDLLRQRGAQQSEKMGATSHDVVTWDMITQNEMDLHQVLQRVCNATARIDSSKLCFGFGWFLPRDFPNYGGEIRGRRNDREVIKTKLTDSRQSPRVVTGNLFGLSKRHSCPMFLQRVQGGLFSTSHRIFCFLHAFCSC
jgi:hypothetical protein